MRGLLALAAATAMVALGSGFRVLTREGIFFEKRELSGFRYLPDKSRLVGMVEREGLLQVCPGAVDMLKAVGMKRVKRESWRFQGLESEPESVADHSYSLTMMILFSYPEIKEIHKAMDKLKPGSGHGGIPDLDKMIKMALVHDLSEVSVGDMTTHGPASMLGENKKNMESRAIHAMFPMVQGVDNEINTLWHEYEEQKTLEALYVKGFDSLELAYQALSYRAQQPGVNVGFWIDTVVQRMEDKMNGGKTVKGQFQSQHIPLLFFKSHIEFVKSMKEKLAVDSFTSLGCDFTKRDTETSAFDYVIPWKSRDRGTIPQEAEAIVTEANGGRHLRS